MPPLPDTLPTLFQLGFYRWNVMKAFFSSPPSPLRFLDLSPKGFIDPLLSASSRRFKVANFSPILALASPPPPSWNSPHVPAPSSSPSISSSSGKCHPRIYSFARSRRLICSSRFPLEITFLFLFASISIERMKNRGGSLRFLVRVVKRVDEERRDIFARSSRILDGDIPVENLFRPMASNSSGWGGSRGRCLRWGPDR